MPRSRKRHKHHHHHTSHSHQEHSSKPKRRSAVPIMIVFIAILGLVIAFISSGEITWLAAGTVVGGITGYFIGHSMDKLAARNR